LRTIAKKIDAPLRARILIVDDERSFVGVMAMVLGDAGFDFITAYDGETALRRIRDDAPDLLLLDLELPRVSGDEVARSIVEHARIPVIVLSGRKEPHEIAPSSISALTTTLPNRSHARSCWRASVRPCAARNASTDVRASMVSPSTSPASRHASIPGGSS
jgi:CheY-like chemotaxis protein